MTHIYLRYNPAKCPRALLPVFVAVPNVACSYCLLQIISTCIGPLPSGAADAGTAGRPLHTIRSCLHITTTNAHRTRRNVDDLAGFAEKLTEKPTERCSVSVSIFFGFFSKTDRNRPTFWWETEKTPRAIFYFRSQPLNILRTYAALTALICSGSILRTMAECYSYLRD